MKNLVKVVLMALIVCLVLSFASCFGEGDNKKTNTETSTQTSTQTSTNTNTNTSTNTSTETNIGTDTDTSTNTDEDECSHNWVISKGSDATCTEKGSTDSVFCTLCRKYLIESEIIYPYGHQKGKTPAVSPTCEESGLSEGEACGRCGMVFVEQEEIAPLGHVEEILEAKEPSCHEAGLTEGIWCSVCEKILVEQESYGTPLHKYDYYGDCTACDAKIGEAIVVVVDVSSSMKELVSEERITRFAVIKQAVIEFVYSLESYDYVGVILFDGNAHLTVEFSSVEKGTALLQELDYKFDHSYYSYYIDKSTGEESDIRINFQKDGTPGQGNIYVDTINGVEPKYILPNEFDRGGQDKLTGDYIKAYGTSYMPPIEMAKEMYDSFEGEVVSKKILFISDGEPNDSGSGYESIISELANDGVVTDAVSMDPNTERLSDTLLAISTAGNGSFKVISEAGIASYALQNSYRKAVKNGVFDKIDGFKFFVYNDSPYVYAYEGEERDLVFPESYKGEKYEICEMGFMGNIIESITISDGVESIPAYAFCRLKTLTAVNLGDSVKTIGNYAFYDCYELTSVTVGKNVEAIENYAFSNCYKLYEVYNLSSLNIVAHASTYGQVASRAVVVHISLDEESILSVTDDGYVFAVYDWQGREYVELISYRGSSNELVLPQGYNGKKYDVIQNAFYKRTDITKVTVNGGIGVIFNGAFNGGTAIKEVHTDSLESWCDIEFNSATANPLYFAHDLYIDGNLVTELSIPEAVTEIKPFTFAGGSFTSVIIPNTVTAIGGGAFTGCEVEEVHTDSLESWCNIEFGNSSANPLSANGNLYVDGNLVTELSIPEAVTEIKPCAFSGGSFTRVVIPNTVTAIGNSAFRVCIALENITLSDALTSIEDYTFYGCTSLSSISLPSGITKIGSYAFYNCGALTSVEIPTGVTAIENYSFYGCTSLRRVTLPSDVTTIGNYAFNGCTSLVSITLPSKLRSIGSSAFYGCEKLWEIYNLSSFTLIKGETSNGYIAYYAKAIHTSLDEDSIFIDVGDYSFLNGENGTIYLYDYTGKNQGCVLPQSCNGKQYVIASNAFEGRNDLICVVITGGVKEIQSRAFYNCDELRVVILSESVEKIADDAFSSCDKISYNEYENGYYIGTADNPYYALVGIKPLAKSCIVHDDVEIVLNNAFSQASINFEYNEYEDCCYVGTKNNPYYVLVKVMGSRNHIESCTIHKDAKRILSSAFVNCEALAEIKLKAGTIINVVGLWKDNANLYETGDIISTGADVTFEVLSVKDDYMLVSTEAMLKQAIKEERTAVLVADINITSTITEFNFSSLVNNIYTINLNGYNITFNSSLAVCSSGQRYGLNICGEGTITYLGSGTFARMTGHGWGGDNCVLTIGKDVTINVPNATLVNDGSSHFVNGYPWIKIYGKVVCGNVLNISNSSNRNPRIDVYDGAKLTVNNKICAHSVVGNTAKITISGGTIISSSTINSFFDDSSIFAITGGTFYFEYSGDKSTLERRINSTDYEVTATVIDEKVYYKVELKTNDLNVSIDFGQLEGLLP